MTPSGPALPPPTLDERHMATMSPDAPPPPRSPNRFDQQRGLPAAHGGVRRSHHPEIRCVGRLGFISDTEGRSLFASIRPPGGGRSSGAGGLAKTVRRIRSRGRRPCQAPRAFHGRSRGLRWMASSALQGLDQRNTVLSFTMLSMACRAQEDKLSASHWPARLLRMSSRLAPAASRASIVKS